MTSGLWALDYGIKLNLGISTGAGQDWQELLDEVGNRDFADSLGTLGLGCFAEIPLSSVNFFSPELNYVINRGIHLSNGKDEYIKIAALNSLELILPVTRIFPLSSEDKIFRLSGGFQILYSRNLVETSRLNGIKQKSKMKNQSPLSLGFMLASGMEFKRQEKRNWLGDMRLMIPFSDRLSYDDKLGNRVTLKTVELLLSGGIRF
ncbi:hypothetical protein EXM22_01275 [Oceanispirochaeta crateris]|uniref:Outer membrane protein beta-barrel domain-containing protein n=1 Tax=Oceanispirochaeta crateris TaxID=2518645 RepID=A0A5C1QGU4_9SPIO|nr:hypothetical protein [Oceanispirochaeta crateris]QEN06687.1 hypothetical protein EXM22_01275 [Oceanispirochaeta crateris]